MKFPLEILVVARDERIQNPALHPLSDAQLAFGSDTWPKGIRFRYASTIQDARSQLPFVQGVLMDVRFPSLEEHFFQESGYAGGLQLARECLDGSLPVVWAVADVSSPATRHLRAWGKAHGIDLFYFGTYYLHSEVTWKQMLLGLLALLFGIELGYMAVCKDGIQLVNKLAEEPTEKNSHWHPAELKNWVDMFQCDPSLIENDEVAQNLDCLGLTSYR